MYAKELIATGILFALTFIFALIGMNDLRIAVAQDHLKILIIIYLILLPIDAVWTYINYFRFRKPKFLWAMISEVRMLKRRFANDDIYKLEDIIKRQKSLVRIAFDDIGSSDVQKRKAGLTQIKELWS